MFARELVRPWKLFTFGISMSWLLYGALFYNVQDWDVGVTLLMGILTYLLAPWSVYIIYSAIKYRPKHWYFHIMTALVAWLFVVDWIYMLYHTIMGNQTLREANFYTSTPLYFMAGIVWFYRGSLKDLLNNIRRLV